MSLLRGGGGLIQQDKNTSVRVCAKNAGGAYARGGGGGGGGGGAYLRDTTVLSLEACTSPISAMP